MLTDDRLTAIWLGGSVVKWILMPALESIPRIRKLEIGQKRALVAVLCVLTAPIYFHCETLTDVLFIGLSAALVAIGQHHLFKGNREK